jgi:hypothetical protein
MKRIALVLVVLASSCKKTDSAPAPPAADPSSAALGHPAPRGPAPNLAPDRAAQAAPEDSEVAHQRRRDRDSKDLDGDGKISPAERAAAHKERTERIRAAWDANGDGKLTVDEVAAAPGGMRFPDPAALDTNGDGDISVEELNAGMEARRAANRMQRLGRGSGEAAPPAHDWLDR